MELKLVRTPAEETLMSRIAHHASHAKSPSLEVEALREKASSLFAKKGLPNKRIEAWKYTDLKALMAHIAQEAPLAFSSEDVSRAKTLHTHSVLYSLPLHGLVGATFHGLAPLPKGVSVLLFDAQKHGKHLGKALNLPADNAAVQLNSALMGDIVVVHVGASTKVSEPLHLGIIAPWTSAVALSPRMLVVVEKGASLTLIEHHMSAHSIKHQINSVIELLIDNEASCEHIRINAHGNEVLALSTLAVTLGEKSELTSFNVVTQPAASRHQVFATFAGEYAHATINGAALLKGTQHADLTLVVDHAQPHGTSRETFKTVLDGSSTGVFQGQIQVKAKAQKTDGRMSSNALMLSDDVTMYNKPELEIFADDVQCAHGATCGALDHDLLFYLLARGISRTEAEGLMVQAFVGDALEPIRDDTVREALMGMVEGWVKGRKS
jgi:Fe-S cluster assembly protein SufD